VIQESRLGLTTARLAGIAASQYDYIAFVDDDNWLAEDWLVRAAEVMDAHPEIAACGGRNDAICEGSLPHWFPRYAINFAVGCQADERGYLPDSAYLWGAGLVVRKAAFVALQRKGLQLLSSDRKGTELLGGGDTEMQMALRATNWKLWYEPAMRLQHFMPKARLSWRYLRKLYRGFGRSSVTSDFYMALLNQHFGFRETWLWKVQAAVRMFVPHSAAFIAGLWSEREGDRKILIAEQGFGRLLGVIRGIGYYDTQMRAMQSADWRVSQSDGKCSGEAMRVVEKLVE
jgi:glycosyltransferase involved in cell wall biosynthesis